MGKQSNANNATQLRQFRDDLRKKQKDEKKRQTKITLLIIASALVICAVIVLLILLLNNPAGSTDANNNDFVPDVGPEPTMDDLDFSNIELNSFTETDEITNYVQMSVTYTDADGARQTGNIVIRLFDEVAPTTVKNFQDLVKAGFYNGSSFHRVMKDFMIQGGSGKGEASLTPIQGEFTNNGFVNNLEHIRGVVSMARTETDKNSATSQFFIVHKDTIELDSNYASFGYVVYGMDTVDAIAETEVVANPNNTGELSSPVNSITINYMKFITYEKT